MENVRWFIALTVLSCVIKLCDGSTMCSLDLRSAGYNDASPIYSHMKANGVTYGYRAPDDPNNMVIYRGLTFMRVLITKTGCSLVDAHQYDTHDSYAAVSNMNTYLNGLSVNDDMYVCVAHDTAATYLPTHGGTAAIINNFGVDLSSLGLRWVTAFIAKKEQPEFARKVVKQYGPAILTASMKYDRVVLTNTDEQPSSAPYTTSEAETHRKCCHLCNLDDDCYTVGALMDAATGKWTCDFHGQLSAGEVYTSAPGYRMYQATITVYSVDTM